MRLREILTYQPRHKPVSYAISIYKKYGSATGYICTNVDENNTQIYNWCSKHGVPAVVVDGVIKDYNHNNPRTLSSVAVLDNINTETTRNKGYGTKLMDSFITNVQNRNGQMIMLIADTAEEQTNGFDLVKWYQNYGFETIMTTASGPFMLCVEL